MIIRATQKKMMSKPVTSTDDGRNEAELARLASASRASRMAPQRRREPGVEHVVVAPQRAGSRPSFARACARASSSLRAT